MGSGNTLSIRQDNKMRYPIQRDSMPRQLGLTRPKSGAGVLFPVFRYNRRNPSYPPF
jgi:hypothetical protein